MVTVRKGPSHGPVTDIMHKTIALVVFEVCKQTDRQKDIHTHHNTSHPSRGATAMRCIIRNTFYHNYCTKYQCVTIKFFHSGQQKRHMLVIEACSNYYILIIRPRRLRSCVIA